MIKLTCPACTPHASHGSHSVTGRCGPARHAALLAKSGARVWALDASEPMLEYARQLAQEAGADVTFVRGDMADFDLEVGGCASTPSTGLHVRARCLAYLAALCP